MDLRVDTGRRKLVPVWCRCCSVDVWDEAHAAHAARLAGGAGSGHTQGEMTVRVDLSDSAIKALQAETEDDAVAELRLAAAVKLYELERLSPGAAAAG